ncbi:MAG: 50S ribosomal protein L17 [Chitinispirillaceae bacterium]
MRHLSTGRKLNRTASHRRAMLSNLAVSILDKERVETTLPKAKEVRGVVERLITYAKKGDLAARRLAARRVNDTTVLRKLFAEIGPAFKDRNGGYTRIVKTRERKGDNALMAIVELVGIGGAETVRRRRKQKKKQPVGKTVEPTSLESDNKDTTAADGPK